MTPKINTTVYGKHSIRYIGPVIWGSLVSKISLRARHMNKVITIIIIIIIIIIIYYFTEFHHGVRRKIYGGAKEASTIT